MNTKKFAKQYKVRFTQEQVKRLQALAKHRGCTITALIRAAVDRLPKPRFK